MGQDAVESDEQAVLDLERRRIAATNSRDQAAMRALLAPEFIQVHTTGRVDDAATFVGDLAKSGRQIISREPRVRLYGDTAVVTGPQRIDFNESPPRISDTQCSLVAHRSAGEWRFVLLQATVVRG